MTAGPRVLVFPYCFFRPALLSPRHSRGHAIPRRLARRRRGRGENGPPPTSPPRAPTVMAAPPRAALQRRLAGVIVYADVRFYVDVVM
jgi:hypothetical protein